MCRGRARRSLRARVRRLNFDRRTTRRLTSRHDRVLQMCARALIASRPVVRRAESGARARVCGIRRLYDKKLLACFYELRARAVINPPAHSDCPQRASLCSRSFCVRVRQIAGARANVDDARRVATIKMRAAALMLALRTQALGRVARCTNSDNAKMTVEKSKFALPIFANNSEFTKVEAREKLASHVPLKAHASAITSVAYMTSKRKPPFSGWPPPPPPSLTPPPPSPRRQFARRHVRRRFLQSASRRACGESASENDHVLSPRFNLFCSRAFFLLSAVVHILSARSLFFYLFVCNY